MKKCPRCNSEVSDDSKFCPNCGLNFEEYQQEYTQSSDGQNDQYIICPNCRHKVSKNNKFCPYCGHPLHNNEETNSQPQFNSRLTSSRSQQTRQSQTPQGWERGMSKQFSASALLFWVKGYISENDNGIDVQYPNTVFFGLIPAGNETRHFTLKSITSPGVNTQYSIKDFLIGAVIAIIGLFTIFAVIGIIFLLIGAGIFCNGIMTEFSLQDNGGEFYFNVPFYDRKDIEMITDDINRRIEEVQNRRDQSRNLGNFFNPHY